MGRAAVIPEVRAAGTHGTHPGYGAGGRLGALEKGAAAWASSSLVDGKQNRLDGSRVGRVRTEEEENGEVRRKDNGVSALLPAIADERVPRTGVCT